MTYQINIKKSKVEEFLLIIESLKKLGVVQSFKSTESLAIPTEGEPASTDELMKILDRAEKEITESKVVPSEQVHKMIQSWK